MGNYIGGGRTVHLGPDKVSWYDAMNYCRINHDGVLASIRTREEQIYIENEFGCDIYPCWLGAVRMSVSSTQFAWVDGSAWSFDNLDAGEPNNVDGNQNCLYTYPLKYGRWDDTNCLTGRSYPVCQTYIWTGPFTLVFSLLLVFIVLASAYMYYYRTQSTAGLEKLREQRRRLERRVRDLVAENNAKIVVPHNPGIRDPNLDDDLDAMAKGILIGKSME